MGHTEVALDDVFLDEVCCGGKVHFSHSFLLYYHSLRGSLSSHLFPLNAGHLSIELLIVYVVILSCVIVRGQLLVHVTRHDIATEHIEVVVGHSHVGIVGVVVGGDSLNLFD